MNWMGVLRAGAKRYGPRALQAAQRSAGKLAQSPAAQRQALALVGGVPERLHGVPVTRHQRLAARVDAVRASASNRLATAGDPATKERAREWLARADRLRSSLDLAASTRRQQRKGHLDRVAGSLDALVAEMIDSLGDPPQGP